MNGIDNHKRNQLLLVLFIGVLMGALDIAIVGPALPAIQTYFGVGERAIAWIFAIYVLFNLVGTPLMAKLSDALGRRSIYILDVTLFALGSLLVASAPNFGLLLAGRAIQGFGAGGIFPVASAVIGDTFPPEKRGSALGLIGAVFGLAFLVGPILGGILLMFDWRWLFVVNLPIALAVIAMSLRLLPATRPEQRRPFDWPGMAVLGLLLASLAYGLNQIDTQHLLASLPSLNVWPFLLAVLVLLPIFWWVERRAPDPVLRLGLFNSRQVVIASALAGGAGLGEAAVVFIPALVVAAFGVTSSTASFMLVPAVLAMGVGAPLSGRMLDRFGARMVVVLGTALLTAGMLLVSLLSINLVLFYLAAILVGLGLSSLLGASLRYIMLNEAPASDRAAAQGALTIFISVGQLLSGALVGAVAASRGGGVTGYQAAYLLVGIVALVLTLLSSGLKGHAEELSAARRGETPASAEPARAPGGSQQRGSET
jgi:EmrB/QacA subfamily drug resistance transporter